MKRILIIGMLLAAGWAQASVSVSQTFTENAAVQQGDPIPMYFTENFSAATAGFTVLSLTVSLNVTGGYASGFYSYLIAPNGSQVVLLNYPGVSSDPLGIGNTTPGLNLTLATSGTTIDENVNLMNGGTYASYQSLAGMSGSSANGSWTLVFGDTLSADNGNPLLNSWSLNITAVPEPVNVAMAIFSLLAAVLIVGSSLIKIRTTPRHNRTPPQAK